MTSSHSNPRFAGLREALRALPVRVEAPAWLDASLNLAGQAVSARSFWPGAV